MTPEGNVHCSGTSTSTFLFTSHHTYDHANDFFQVTENLKYQVNTTQFNVYFNYF